MDHKAALRCSEPHVQIATKMAEKQSIAQGRKLIRVTTHTHIHVCAHTDRHTKVVIYYIVSMSWNMILGQIYMFENKYHKISMEDLIGSMCVYIYMHVCVCVCVCVFKSLKNMFLKVIAKVILLLQAAIRKYYTEWEVYKKQRFISHSSGV